MRLNICRHPIPLPCLWLWVLWLEKGDKNTAYFHQKVNGHQARNKIMSITDLQGQRIHGEENVHKEVISLFSQLLGVYNNRGSFRHRIEEVISKRLSEVQQRHLDVSVTPGGSETGFVLY